MAGLFLSPSWPVLRWLPARLGSLPSFTPQQGPRRRFGARNARLRGWDPAHDRLSLLLGLMGKASRKTTASMRPGNRRDPGIMANPWESRQIPGNHSKSSKSHRLCWKTLPRAAPQGRREIPQRKAGR